MEEKKMLSEQTGLQLSQVNNWFAHTRFSLSKGESVSFQKKPILEEFYLKKKIPSNNELISLSKKLDIDIFKLTKWFNNKNYGSIFYFILYYFSWYNY